MCICVGARRGQKRISDTPKLELQEVVRESHLSSPRDGLFKMWFPARAHKGAGLADPKLQELHDPGQQ